MSSRSVLVLISLAIAACSSYPDIKDNKTLTCWSSKPFLTGKVNGNDGVFGNWENKERISSVKNIRKFADKPEAAFGRIIVTFPDTQPIFNELKLQSKETVISSQMTSSSRRQDGYQGGNQFEGRPYYVFFFKVAEIKPYIERTTSLDIVAYSDQGRVTAQQVINIGHVVEVLSEIDVMIADSKDMRENRRSECRYEKIMTMPIEVPPW